ncbi:hypothetical protein QYF61_016286 [Mycteria americana]|uniref:small monomeric GTPase n=1 Tax=Mycteria americana TaxID=33587 RepID=A0AAN7NHZ8_MYCAM|nr:hypothetical protein QYF61_016286 [Mycteria americana]
MLDNPLGEEKFPNIQSKPPLAQLEAISSCPITCYLGEETDPHLSTTSFQMASAQDSRYGQKDTSDQNFDYMFKLLIIGNSSVGKTSFLFRYADDSFTSAFVSTVGIDFKVKTVFKNEKRIKLQIWNQGPVFSAKEDLGNVKGILSSDRLQCKEHMLYAL